VKQIFALTKSEQRVVILIIVALVAIAFTRHWFETKSQPQSSVTPISASPTATPAVSPREEQSDSED
jgi:hypothetical protein